MFCPKCGSIMIPRKEGSKKILACSCGYKSGEAEHTKIRETVQKSTKEIEIIEKDDFETLPKMSVECEKCGHGTAYFWTMQTRAGDEPETKFMKCEKCLHTWRDYD